MGIIRICDKREKKKYILKLVNLNMHEWKFGSFFFSVLFSSFLIPVFRKTLEQTTNFVDVVVSHIKHVQDIETKSISARIQTNFTSLILSSHARTQEQLIN